jgi:hypothetical protein
VTNKIINFSSFLTVLILYSSSVYANPIEIKGLYIGMPKEDFKKQFPTLNSFTIAGVYSKFKSTNPINIKYRNGKIDDLGFFFESENFQTVLSAVKEKYPELSCETSEVSNGAGIKFSQVKCTLEDSESILTLNRFIGDINTSMLNLTSKKYIQELVDEANKNQKDI